MAESPLTEHDPLITLRPGAEYEALKVGEDKDSGFPSSAGTALALTKDSLGLEPVAPPNLNDWLRWDMKAMRFPERMDNSSL